MAEMTQLEMVQKMDQMMALLEKGNKPSRGSPAGVVGDINESWRQRTDKEWPAHQLKALSDVYGGPESLEMFGKKKNGKYRVSGIGPQLVKMAAMATKGTENNAWQVAKNQGLYEENYGLEQFEREYGFYPANVPHVQKTPHGEVRKTALAEGSGQTGGYVIPPQFQNELMTIAAEDGFIEQRAKVIPMNTRSVQWPMLDITTKQATGTTPYFGGILAQWQPEAVSINETEPQFKQSEWVAWDLVLYTVSSNQLLADNGIGLDALLTQLFGQAITWYKEFAYLQGTGTGSTMPLGVLNAPATLLQKRAVANRFLMSDAAAMMSHLQIRSWDDACWIMHQSVLPQLIMMQDAAAANQTQLANVPAGNRLSWLTPYGDGEKGPAAMKLPNAFLNGLPIFFTEKTVQLGTTGDVLLVDWSRYIIGMRLDLQIDVSPHFLFRNNQLAWRVIARCDGKPWLNNFITDQTGFQVSPFISLSTTATSTAY
jgi:HK97 family phage major capsid protein